MIRRRVRFDFAAAYTRNDDRDRVYNDPRVWQIQKLFNPSVIQPVEDGREFGVFMKPERKLSLEDAKRVMRDHFDGSEHDPYSHGLNGNEPWRPRQRLPHLRSARHAGSSLAAESYW